MSGIRDYPWSGYLQERCGHTEDGWPAIHGRTALAQETRDLVLCVMNAAHYARSTSSAWLLPLRESLLVRRVYVGRRPEQSAYQPTLRGARLVAKHAKGRAAELIAELIPQLEADELETAWESVSQQD